MNLHKILKIVAAVLGLAGIVFLIRIINAGDEAIKNDALMGETGIVEPMAIVAYIIVCITIFLVLVFVLKNLFTNTANLKKTLMGVGLFAAVLIIAYAVSGGDPNAYFYNDVQASEAQSHMVGAGLTAFYILIFTAAGTMLFSGIKKAINK